MLLLRKSRESLRQHKSKITQENGNNYGYQNLTFFFIQLFSEWILGYCNQIIMSQHFYKFSYAKVNFNF